MCIKFRISVIPGSFDQDRERSASHPGSDLIDFVFAIGSQLGCLSDEIHLIQNEVSRFGIRLHLVKVRPFHSSDWQLIRNRE